ncbi:tryptophan synthase beta chain [Ereboglobus sp. PH5-10]|uniref:tryptophan synthase subunit beta n=1 Tax=Ereboglobus sp. PH5-10 TaxID=2940629 RepID=UPI002406F297|nr:tryptophan synthase subunit beta [Ereboglobus sp. PH5-10]MDF9826822.1 tryptophan synthase beta chain [Ereboglobus sp. PH5-10]
MNTHYGTYGGQYVAETLMPALEEIADAFDGALRDTAFQDELAALLADYVGRETPLYFARRLSARTGGAKIYLKREDLNHTGAHKVNNALGQALLAKRMGKTRLIAETGAGMHGVAAATAAALLGMPCEVFMGEEDVSRQSPNVERMRILGAKVVSVCAGSRTLKDAMNEALRDWVASFENTFYVIGTAAGPAPYPEIVKHFQSVIGAEARRQILEKENKLPAQVIACVGGGSNAIGIFSGFEADKNTALIGAEAAGRGLGTGQHAASLCGGSLGVLHGSKTFLLQDKDGQILDTYSISAGLDYPGVGPEHAHLRDTGRARYVPVTDDEALDAFNALAQFEGIIPALESSHAVAVALKNARALPCDESIVVCLSGRGDKDLAHIRRHAEQNKNQ